MYRDNFRKYLYRKLKDLPVNEKMELLQEIEIATMQVKAELNSQCVYCETCRKHFLKVLCKERIAEEKEFVSDDERDDNWFQKGINYVHKMLYRICPECGRDDLYDKILETKVYK